MVTQVKFSRGKKIIAGIVVVTLLWFAFLLPGKLFNKPTCFVIEDARENLLSASIASDGQWRFPAIEKVPGKFVRCITTYEDKRFFYHPGVDPFALARAIYSNLRTRRGVSGASTLTMQVIRLSRSQPRTIWEKIIESIVSLRLECSYNKQAILALYASHAPFGSNVVGLEAAAWRYYGRAPDKLSWGEMALLAVLPNSPSLVHPGKNRQLLLRKRNDLVDKLVKNKVIEFTTGELAKLEPVPSAPLPLPQLAPHLLARFKKEFHLLRKENMQLTTRLKSTLNLNMQQNLNVLLNRHHNVLRGNGINNAAALVVEVETGSVVAYAGNVHTPGEDNDSYVDILASPRSPGSTLKPLLYAAMQTDGLILPQQLVPDVPMQIGSYKPENFNAEFDGAVPASQALSRSLNIPAVKMLQQYKFARFYDVLKQCGFTTLNRQAGHYGLSLILGGCEVTAWQLAGVYSSMARTYNHQENKKGKQDGADWRMPVYFTSSKRREKQTQVAPFAFDYTSLWHTFNAMQEVMRPGEEGLWNLFNAAQRIAWKTGTSFGYRDGWAIGITPRYCVVVWVGNANGEGRPELTGINTAAPLMFDIFRSLPPSIWFAPPSYDYAYLTVCHQSGFRASVNCNDVDTMLTSTNGIKSPQCPYHRIIHLDHSGSFRVTEKCEAPSRMVNKSWFTLPPAMEFFYKMKHTDYQPLPLYRKGCIPESAVQMEIIYPGEDARIYIPLEISGQKGKTVFTATHRDTGAKLFWHLDNEYVGSTLRFHQLAFNPAKGRHQLTIVDQNGLSVTRKFEVVDKENEY